MITDERVLANIKYYMQREGWSQRGLAGQISMREGTLSKILTGRRPLRAMELGAIAEALHVSPNDLLEIYL
jgi:transcriptional regulator with XRE-family HTH domain